MFGVHVLDSRRWHDDQWSIQGFIWRMVMCRVELIASMAWKRRLSEQSCLTPSHHTYQEKKMKCKFKRSISKKSYAWSLSPIWRYWSSEDVLMRGSPTLVYGGAKFEVFIKHVLSSTIERCSNLKESRLSSSSSSGMRKANVWSW